MPKIVTLTVNPALDKSSDVEYVIPGQKLRCSAPKWHPGGGGINVARVIQRLGGAPLAMYFAGGPPGEQLRQLLAAEGIEQAIVLLKESTRVSFTVLETDRNQQYRFSVPGPEVAESEWRAGLWQLKALAPRPEYIVLSGGLLPGAPSDFYGRIAHWALANDIQIILDTHDEPLRLAIRTRVFLAKPNLRELRQLTQRELASEDEQRQAVRRLIDEGAAQYILLSLGADGAIFASTTGTHRLRAPSVTVRSKVGAGDSMVGSLVWALAQGYTPLEAARFGVAAGAAAVKTAGSELCHADDVHDLYEKVQAADSAPA